MAGQDRMKMMIIVQYFFDNYLQPWASKFVSVACVFIHFFHVVCLYKVDLEFTG